MTAGLKAALLAESREERESWLIQLRWVALAGVAAVVAISASLDLVAAPGPLFVIAAAVAAYNLGFLLLQRRGGKLAEALGADQRIFLQVVLDLAALTTLLHWSGGMSNPFAMFFAFHAAIAAIVFSRRFAVLVGLATVVMFGGTVVAEKIGVLPHYPLTGPAATPAPTWTMIAGFLIAFVLTVFGVIHFVDRIRQQRQRAEDLAREQERLAESRNRMARIGEISTGVAHTVRNPLHGLMSCVTLLERSVPEIDSEGREILGMMSEGLRRINVVTERLLHFSRDDLVTRTPHDIEEVIRKALDHVGDRDLVRRCVVHDVQDVPAVDLDEERIVEALINLVDNALHAVRDGGSVTVRARAVEENGTPHVRVEVEDSGEGIPKENLDRIFDAFFTTKTITEGSGLGLSIVRKIVEAHGGRIIVESEESVGTRFSMLFPMAESRAGSPVA